MNKGPWQLIRPNLFNSTGFISAIGYSETPRSSGLVQFNKEFCVLATRYLGPFNTKLFNTVTHQIIILVFIRL